MESTVHLRPGKPEAELHLLSGQIPVPCNHESATGGQLTTVDVTGPLLPSCNVNTPAVDAALKAICWISLPEPCWAVAVANVPPVNVLLTTVTCGTLVLPQALTNVMTKLLPTPLTDTLPIPTIASKAD